MSIPAGLTGAASQSSDSPRCSLLFVAPVEARRKVSENDSQITRLLSEFAAAGISAEKLVSGRDESLLSAHLGPGSWSVSECLDHLAKTTRAFLPPIANAICHAKPLEMNRRLRTGALASIVIRNLEPPYRLRYKVLHQLKPRQGDFATAWLDFRESQVELQTTVRSAAGLAIDQVRIKSPVYARMSYNVYGALRILAVHERRHLWQVERILERLDRR